MKKSYFNYAGRRIPPLEFADDIARPNGNVKLIQPRINYSERLSLLHEFFDKTGIKDNQFQEEVERVRLKIKRDDKLSNLFNNVHLPIVIPAKLSLSGFDLKRLVEAISDSYEQCYPQRLFHNCLEENWGLYVDNVQFCRHDILLEKIQEKPLIGWHFPLALECFSVDAQRKQIEELPWDIFLSGIDTLIAHIMYPDVLCRDNNTPHHDLPALSWITCKNSLYLGAGESNLRFGFSNRTNFPYPECSGGLFAFSNGY